MGEGGFRHKKGIILAADLEDSVQLTQVTQEVSPYVDAIKIGNVALLSNGLELIPRLKEVSGLPIIVDLKLADVPVICARVSTILRKAEADGLLISGLAGLEAIVACKENFGSGMVFVLSQFTHCSGLVDDPTADSCIQMAICVGCEGVVVPGTRPDRIRAVRESLTGGQLIISCGIGAQGPKVGSAISAGSDYEIIGRAIYDRSWTCVRPEVAAAEARRAIDKAARRPDGALERGSPPHMRLLGS